MKTLNQREKILYNLIVERGQEVSIDACAKVFYRALGRKRPKLWLNSVNVVMRNLCMKTNFIEDLRVIERVSRLGVGSKSYYKVK